MQPVRILLVQLGANGDCLFVTTIAKQIKEIDYPGCNLTWMIGKRYRQVIKNNPFIDRIVEVPIQDITDTKYFRERIPELIESESKIYSYDHVFVTDYTYINYDKWFGTTRSSLFRCYPHSFKINPQPLIFLDYEEQIQVNLFCNTNNITDSTYNILFECAPQSGQSRMNFETAHHIANILVSEIDNCKIILSSPTKFESNNVNIIDGSVISWRCNAELVNYCHLFIGCSSGISWLITSNWCKKIPSIQIIDPNYMQGKISASVILDYTYFGLDTSDIIEMKNPRNVEIISCISEVISGNFQIAKIKSDINLNSGFTSFKFLTNLGLSFRIKIYFIFKYWFIGNLIKLYRLNKPSWFRPKVLFRKSLK